MNFFPKNDVCDGSSWSVLCASFRLVSHSIVRSKENLPSNARTHDKYVLVFNSFTKESELFRFSPADDIFGSHMIEFRFHFFPFPLQSQLLRRKLEMAHGDPHVNVLQPYILQ